MKQAQTLLRPWRLCVLAVYLSLSLHAAPPVATRAPVTVTGDQNISGTKNFTGTLQVGGVTLTLPGGNLLGSGETYINPDWLSEISGTKVFGFYTTANLFLEPTRLLGRTSSGSGPAEEIFIGTGLSMADGTIVNTGVISLSGSADQVNVSAGAGDIILTLPQGIGTSSIPQFANVIITHSVISYSNPTYIDFSSDGFNSLYISGDTTFAGSSHGDGRSKTVRIIGDGGNRNLYFPAEWKFVGAPRPTQLPAGKTAILTITCFGWWDGEVVAAYAQEP